MIIFVLWESLSRNTFFSFISSATLVWWTTPFLFKTSRWKMVLLSDFPKGLSNFLLKRWLSWESSNQYLSNIITIIWLCIITFITGFWLVCNIFIIIFRVTRNLIIFYCFLFLPWCFKFRIHNIFMFCYYIIIVVSISIICWSWINRWWIWSRLRLWFYWLPWSKVYLNRRIFWRDFEKILDRDVWVYWL